MTASFEEWQDCRRMFDYIAFARAGHAAIRVGNYAEFIAF
jgi:hypothetical protein